MAWESARLHVRGGDRRGRRRQIKADRGKAGSEAAREDAEEAAATATTGENAECGRPAE